VAFCVIELTRRQLAIAVSLCFGAEGEAEDQAVPDIWRNLVAGVFETDWLLLPKSFQAIKAVHFGYLN
jgi:hypothetical protein